MLRYRTREIVSAARLDPSQAGQETICDGHDCGYRGPRPIQHPLTSVGWIGYIIIGAIAGWIAGKIVKGGGSGILMNIVIGIIGALIGGFLLSFFVDTASGGWWFTLFTAILGAVILLWVVGMVQQRRT